MNNEYESLMCQSDNGHHYATLSDGGLAPAHLLFVSDWRVNST